MKIEVRVAPIYELHLSHDDIVPLRILSNHHYDFVCRKAGDPGGFLYGWSNRVCSPEREPAAGTTPVPCPATFGELNLLLKICEIARVARSAHLITPMQFGGIERLCAMILTALDVAAQEKRDDACTIIEPTEHGRHLWRMNPGRM